MCDQAFPGQPLNDEWMFADPETLILILAEDLEDHDFEHNTNLITFCV
jgi:hypothetical protein